MNKDEYSMIRPGYKPFVSKRSIINLELKKYNTRNNRKNNSFQPRIKNSLPKIKFNSVIKDTNSSALLNYFEKKKHLSFYKGANISVTSLFLDTNKTVSTNAKNTSISCRTHKFKKNFSQNDIFLNDNTNINKTIYNNKKENTINKENDEDDKKIKKKKKEEIKSTINPYLDISNLTYKTDITALRNKFSILFNKEFNLFDKFIPSLYTLKFESDKKYILSQLHANSLACIKYLSSTFLDQDIEHLKINVSNLESILTNLLNLFTYNNKINNYLIKHTKKYMIETNRDKQNKKDLFKVDDNSKINNLMKKLENKNEIIKKIKQDKFEEQNNFMMDLYKLRSEKEDLVKLLLINKNYFIKFKDSQNEIKEKNDIIIQKNIDYKAMVKNNFFEKVELEQDLIELKSMFKPIEEENKIMKEKISELEKKQSMFDEILKSKNGIILRLKENLMMKNEELMKYLNELDKVKNQKEKISYYYFALKNRFGYLSEKDDKMINGDYNDEM